MNTERKYRKQINKDGWMCSVQKWSFGKRTPTFVGYCPFFWFTWLCIFISPLVLVGKFFEFLTNLVVSCWPVSSPQKAKKVERPRDRYIIAYYEKLNSNPKPSESELINFNSYMADDVRAWIAVTPNWEDIAKSLIVKRDRAIEREEKKLQRQAKLQASIKKFAYLSGFIVKPILFLLALAVGYVVLRVSWLFIRQITWGVVIGCGELLGLSLAAAIVVSLLSTLFGKVKLKWSSIPEKPSKYEEDISEDCVANKILECVGNVFGFIKETVGMLYTRECPLIEWGEESKRIEKINK